MCFFALPLFNATCVFDGAGQQLFTFIYSIRMFCSYCRSLLLALRIFVRLSHAVRSSWIFVLFFFFGRERERKSRRRLRKYLWVFLTAQNVWFFFSGCCFRCCSIRHICCFCSAYTEFALLGRSFSWFPHTYILHIYINIACVWMLCCVCVMRVCVCATQLIFINQNTMPFSPMPMLSATHIIISPTNRIFRDNTS